MLPWTLRRSRPRSRQRAARPRHRPRHPKRRPPQPRALVATRLERRRYACLPGMMASGTHATSALSESARLAMASCAAQPKPKWPRSTSRRGSATPARRDSRAQRWRVRGASPRECALTVAATRSHARRYCAHLPEGGDIWPSCTLTGRRPIRRASPKRVADRGAAQNACCHARQPCVVRVDALKVRVSTRGAAHAVPTQRYGEVGLRTLSGRSAEAATRGCRSPQAATARASSTWCSR